MPAQSRRRGCRTALCASAGGSGEARSPLPLWHRLAPRPLPRLLSVVPRTNEKAPLARGFCLVERRISAAGSDSGGHAALTSSDDANSDDANGDGASTDGANPNGACASPNADHASPSAGANALPPA